MWLRCTVFVTLGYLSTCFIWYIAFVICLVNCKWTKRSLVKFLSGEKILTMIVVKNILAYVWKRGIYRFVQDIFQKWQSRSACIHVRVSKEIEKVSVVVICLTADFSSSSLCGSEKVKPLKKLISKVYVCFHGVQASKTLGLGVAYRLLFRGVFFQLCSWRSYCEQKRILVPRQRNCFQRRSRSSFSSGQCIHSGSQFCH